MVLINIFHNAHTIFSIKYYMKHYITNAYYKYLWLISSLQNIYVLLYSFDYIKLIKNKE